MPRSEESKRKDAESKRAQRQRFAALDAIGKEWKVNNPDACPDCSGRPGYHDWAEEGGDEHAPWCKISP